MMRNNVISNNRLKLHIQQQLKKLKQQQLKN